MKFYTFPGFLALLSLQAIPVFSQAGVSDSISKVAIDGNEIVLEKVIEGEVALYRQAYQDEDLFETLGILSPAYETKYHYFIGNSEGIEAIDGGNYKELIPQYLKNALELHSRLGRSGFRFKNLPSMILYYNRFKADHPTKQPYGPREAGLTLIE
ncbi:MAG: hypothetical protein H6556_13895 [Lewinellaceae bacterium]|nr:hypothetical protein [Lewinellaceae bacterium]